MKFRLCYILLLISFYSLGQEDAHHLQLQQAIINLLEEQAENSNSDQNYYALGAKIDALLSTPLDINTATREDFINCLFFTDNEINGILAYRKLYTSFVAIDELKATGVFTDEKLAILKPLLTISTLEHKHVAKNSHQLLMRTQWKTNTNQNYLGSNHGLLTKYTLSSSSLRLGLSLEKDIGEMYYDSLAPLNYFDFSSFFLELKHPFKNVKKVVLGNYGLTSGQGLLFWNSFALGGSFYSINTSRNAPLLSGYTSVNEHNYLQGAAAELSFNNLTITPFFSYKKLNATINSDTTFSTIYIDGLHRTSSELARKNSVNEWLMGTSIDWSKRYFTGGITTAYSSFNKYHTPSFINDSIKNNLYVSIHYRCFFSRFTWSGEVASRNKLKFATIQNLNFQPSSKLGFNLSYRYYSPEYYAVYENAYKSSSRANNERGLYVGINYFVNNQLSLTLFSDWHKNIASTPTKIFPEKGTKQGIQLQFNSEKSIAYIRWANHMREEYSGKANNKEFEFQESNKQTLRFNFTQKIGEKVRLKSRIEYADFGKGKETGLLLFQDFYHQLNYHFKYNFRIAYFSTSTFDAAIYAYESDVLYAFNTTAYFDKGTKYYLNLGYSAGKHFDFWLRTAITSKPSYYQELYENDFKRLWEVKFQLLISY